MAIASIVADAEERIRRRLAAASTGQGGRRRPGCAIPDGVFRRCGGRGCASPARAAGLRRVTARLRPVSGAVARSRARLLRRGRRAKPLDGGDGHPARAPEACAVVAQPRAAFGANRRERARRTPRIDVGQSGHDSCGSRARARRDAEHRVVAGPTRRGRPLDAAAIRSERALSRWGTRIRRVCARSRRCRRPLGNAAALCRRGGRARQLAAGRWNATRRQWRRADPHAVVPWRAGNRRNARVRARRGARGRRRRVDVASRPDPKGREPLPRHSGKRIRVPGAAGANGRRAVARRERARSRCMLQARWNAAARSMGAAATPSGRAT